MKKGLILMVLTIASMALSGCNMVMFGTATIRSNNYEWHQETETGDNSLKQDASGSSVNSESEQESAGEQAVSLPVGEVVSKVADGVAETVTDSVIEGL